MNITTGQDTKTGYTYTQTPYTIRFRFYDRDKARTFKLPAKFSKDYELTHNEDFGQYGFYRTAQRKVR